jgi:fructokinase
VANDIASQEGMDRHKVVAIGEVLWDLLPAGQQLGGAPANYIQHACSLGADAALVSRVGRDERGHEAVARLRARGVATDLIQEDCEAPTGTVGVEIGPDHQPQFTIHENAAWDRLTVADAALAAIGAANAVCFGSLAQRTPTAAKAVQELVAAARPGAWRILDVNLRPPFVDREVVRASLSLANILKLNDHELPVLATMLGLTGSDEEQLAALLRRHSFRLVALTRGGQGSVLLGEEGRSEQRAVAVQVVDTVGAGDAFTAALTLGMLRRWPLDQVHRRAAEVAAFVCTRPGGTPELSKALKRLYDAE